MSGRLKLSHEEAAGREGGGRRQVLALSRWQEKCTLSCCLSRGLLCSSSSDAWQRLGSGGE